MLAQTQTIEGFLVDIYQQFGLTGVGVIVLSLIIIRIVYLQIKLQSNEADFKAKQQKQYLELVESIKVENQKLEKEKSGLSFYVQKLMGELEQAKLKNIKCQFQLKRCLDDCKEHLGDDYEKSLELDTIDLSEYINELNEGSNNE